MHHPTCCSQAGRIILTSLAIYATRQPWRRFDVRCCIMMPSLYIDDVMLSKGQNGEIGLLCVRVRIQQRVADGRVRLLQLLQLFRSFRACMLTQPNIRSAVYADVLTLSGDLVGGFDRAREHRYEKLYYLGFTENLLENTDGGILRPHQRSLGTAACDLLVILTRALLMTSSQSKASSSGKTRAVAPASKLQRSIKGPLPTAS